MSADPSAEARSYGRSAAILTVALGSAGLLAYAFFAIASHSLDPHDYGLVVVLWSTMFISISVLFRPVEQLLSRTVAELEAQHRPIGHALRVAGMIQLAVAAVFAVAAVIARDAIENDLFKGDELFFYALLASSLGFAASYFIRGLLAGGRQFGYYAALLLIDGTCRLVFALAVAVGIADGVAPIAIGIAVAPALTVIVLPFALRARGRAAPPIEPAAPSAGPVGEAAPEFSLAQGGGFAAAVLLIMLSEQVILNGGPLFANAEEGSAAAGFIFNVLMVARAPIVLFQAVATSLLPHLTRLRSQGGELNDDAFDLSIRVTQRTIAAFAGLTMAVVLVAGPTLMQLAFGDKFEYDRGELAIVAGGMGLYLMDATLNQAALAQGQVRRAALCWVVAAAAFAIWNLTGVFDVFMRIEIGFTAAAGILCGLLYLVHRRPHPRPEDVPTPGSPLEIELRAAAADEAG